MRWQAAQLDQLRGKIIGVIQAPATKVAGVVQAPARPHSPVLPLTVPKKRLNFNEPNQTLIIRNLDHG